MIPYGNTLEASLEDNLDKQKLDIVPASLEKKHCRESEMQ
jgi:hypothetical protein